ncbi:MAG TPA: hypothetical protein VFX03_10095 [Thermomicrobiales bacterium]|nr:hypothetical protein [Thermomicrobiales bacterium]
MDDARFDAVVKRLETSGTSRRAGVRALAAAAFVGATAAYVDPFGAAAKRRTKKKKTKATYECAGSTDVISLFQADRRAAARFTASRTGRLRQINFSINNPSGSSGDWVVQLVAVDGATPSTNPIDVLAAVTISDASVPEGQSTITGPFAGTKLTQGVDYAAVLTRRDDFDVAVFFDPATCSGASFTADGAGAFTPLSPDLVVTVLVD